MIYLIDDTPSEMLEKYLKIEDFSDIITRLDNVTQGDLDSLKTADCIMIHSSYHDSIIRRRIASQIADFGDAVPLVMFSDGDLPEAVFDGSRYVTAFKKSCLYSHLAVFLNNFRTSHEVNLNILTEGEHYLRTTASKLASRILSPFTFSDGTEKVKLQDTQRDALKELISISQPNIASDYADVLNDIEIGDVDSLRRKIYKIIDSFNRYGKNIHTWY